MKKRSLIHSTVLMALLVIALVLGTCGCQWSSRTFPVVPDEGQTSQKEVTSLTVTKGPDKTEYFEGQYFDPTGMVVSATWSDGTVENDVSSSDEFFFYDKAFTITDTQVSLFYHEATVTVDVTVKEDALTGLTIKSSPTRTKYFADEEKFDPAGMTLEAVYESGRTEAVKDYTVSDVNLSENPTAVTVSYKTLSVEVPIEVIVSTPNQFEAEGFAVNGGSTIQETYLQMKGTAGSGFTFVFTSNVDTIARFRFYLGGNGSAYDYGKNHTVRLNETEYAVSSSIAAHSDDWGEYVILSANISAGINALTVTNKGATTSNIDYIIVETDATIAESRQYIVAGTSTYSLDGWNKIFPNAVASIDAENDKKLIITLKSGETTNITAADGISPLDGMLDFSLWEGVTINGNGTFNVTYSTAQDGINAYNLTIDEGVTVNLTGNGIASDKSAVKVYENLTINGTFNVSNFTYGQAITKDQSMQIVTTVGEGGCYSIKEVNNGIYAWSSTIQTPIINVQGKFDINAGSNAIYLAKATTMNFTGNSEINIVTTEGYGIYNAKGSVYIRDNSKVSIDSGDSAIYKTLNLVVANGDDLAATTQNNASLTLKANANVIQSDSAGSSFIFNTAGSVLIKGKTAGSFTGIQASSKSSARLVIKCADMTIEDANNAIGAWVTLKSDYMTYDFESAGCAKIKIKNCLAVHNTGYNNVNAFAPLAAANVEIVN